MSSASSSQLARLWSQLVISARPGAGFEGGRVLFVAKLQSSRAELVMLAQASGMALDSSSFS